MSQPLQLIYDTERDELTIDGVKYSGELFRVFASPDPAKFYQLTRKDETITVTEFRREPLRELVLAAKGVAEMGLADWCPTCGSLQRSKFHGDGCPMPRLEAALFHFRGVSGN
jgi:hypothetical protein